VRPSPYEAPIENAVVLVSDGRIEAVGRAGEVAIPAGTRTLDASGKVVVAGFWNSHAHLLGPAYRNVGKAPAAKLESTLREQYGQWGFTTVYDLASAPGEAQALVRRIEAGEVTGPRVLSTGVPCCPAGGTPVYVRGHDLGIEGDVAEVVDAEAGRSRAGEQLAQGARGVKLFTGSIVGGSEGVRLMDAAVASAIGKVARDRGQPVFAHATDAGGLVVALQAGADVLAHATPASGPWDAATVQRLVAEGVALVPTLAMFELEIRREQVPEPVVQRLVGNAQAQVAALQAAGGQCCSAPMPATSRTSIPPANCSCWPRPGSTGARCWPASPPRRRACSARPTRAGASRRVSRPTWWCWGRTRSRAWRRWPTWHTPCAPAS